MAVTGLVLIAAVFCARWLWFHYNVAPWTRDGRIRADVVQVSSDVSGLVTQVLVKNDQVVRPGQLLFVLDRPRYQLALDQAEAAISLQQANLAEAEREARRNRALGDLVTIEQIQQGDAKVQELKAQLNQDQVQRNLARLNLERTTVVAKVNGVATNVELQPGDYAAAGRQALALVNTDSLHVDGYFEETKLPQIRTGDAALIHVMGLPAVLQRPCGEHRSRHRGSGARREQRCARQRQSHL